MPHICIDEYKTTSIQVRRCLFYDFSAVNREAEPMPTTQMIFFCSILPLQTKL